MHDLRGGFVSMLVGQSHHQGEAAHHVESRGNHPAVQPAVQIVADQFGSHLEADARSRRGSRLDLQAQGLVERDPMLVQLGQLGLEPGLLRGAAPGRVGRRAHAPIVVERDDRPSME